MKYRQENQEKSILSTGKTKSQDEKNTKPIWLVWQWRAEWDRDWDREMGSEKRNSNYYYVVFFVSPALRGEVMEKFIPLITGIY